VWAELSRRSVPQENRPAGARGTSVPSSTSKARRCSDRAKYSLPRAAVVAEIVRIRGAFPTREFKITATQGRATLTGQLRTEGQKQQLGAAAARVVGAEERQQSAQYPTEPLSARAGRKQWHTVGQVVGAAQSKTALFMRRLTSRPAGSVTNQRSAASPRLPASLPARPSRGGNRSGVMW
jgi:hypothetical protein